MAARILNVGPHSQVCKAARRRGLGSWVGERARRSATLRRARAAQSRVDSAVRVDCVAVVSSPDQERLAFRHVAPCAHSC